MHKEILKPIKLLAILIAFTLLIQTPVVSANSLSDLKEEKKEAEQNKNNLNSNINQKTKEINSIETKQVSLQAQIQSLGNEITQTNEKITAVASDINKANEEIEKLHASIEALIKKIEDRDALLQDRARAIQAGGTVNYLDVLLGANSFVDFIDRFSAVSTLLDADRQIMREQKTDKESLEEQKYELEDKLNKLEDDKQKLDRLKASLDQQQKEKNNLIDALEREQANLTSEKKLLEAEYSEAVEIDQALQQQIAAEQNRIAEIARQEEQRKKAAAAAAAAKVKAPSSSSSSSDNADIPVSTGGTWMKPTNGRLTSGYGWRNIGFGQEFHYGIDLANSAGTPIVAAADGVVSYAAPLSSYGNFIVVTHSINGQIYSTAYAHLSSYNVSVGTVVSQGQKIGSMGSTGRSTGPHLHFEVHVGSWKGQKAGNQNPLRYISL